MGGLSSLSSLLSHKKTSTHSSVQVRVLKGFTEKLSAQVLAGVVYFLAAIGQSQGHKDAQATAQGAIVWTLIIAIAVPRGRGRGISLSLRKGCACNDQECT